MLKLVKWIAYATFAYLLYEFVAGIANGDGRSRNGNQISSPGRRHSSPHPANMTGNGGRGEFVPVTDSSGGERRARVGRGVVSRRSQS